MKLCKDCQGSGKIIVTCIVAECKDGHCWPVEIETLEDCPECDGTGEVI